MKLVNREGKPVSLEGLDPNIAGVLEEAFGGITHQMSAAMSASIKPIETKLNESLTTINESIAGLKPAEGEANKKAETPTEVTTTDPATKAILAKLEAMEKKQNELEQSTAAEREAKAAASITQSFIDKQFPNLTGKDIIIARITAAKPKDEDAVKAELDKIKGEQEAIYGKETVEKIFSADPAAEGGESGEVDDTEAEAKAKIEKMESTLKSS